MKTALEIYKEKLKTPFEALDLIKDNDHIIASQAAAEPVEIMSAIQHLKKTGVKGCKLTTTLPFGKYPCFSDKELKGIVEHNPWFLSAELRKAYLNKMCSPIPQNSTTFIKNILSRCKAEGRRPVLITTVSPMDKHGFMSLSLSAMYEMDLAKSGALIIVEENKNFPRTFGDTQLHVSEVDAIVISSNPIPTVSQKEPSEIDKIIGKSIADLIDDGSTIQIGIGNIPNAVAYELRSKKHLGIHTEMFTEAMVDLIECGAVDNSMKGFYDGYSVCSFTFGSQKLYDFIDDNPSILFKSCRMTNEPYFISKNRKFVSINTAMEIDLLGQVASETVNGIPWSGTGGQLDTVRGAQLSEDGKSFIAMHSTYPVIENGREKIKSKIVPSFEKNQVVSTGRNDVDFIVTEYGVARLKGLSIGERANALIDIAHPDFREELKRRANELMIW